jgi:hypothetical protein
MGRPESSHFRYQTLKDALKECRASNGVIGVGKAIQMMDLVAEKGEIVTYLTVIALPRERRIVFAISPGEGVSATRGRWAEVSWGQVLGAF